MDKTIKHEKAIDKKIFTMLNESFIKKILNNMKKNSQKIIPPLLLMLLYSINPLKLYVALE